MDLGKCLAQSLQDLRDVNEHLRTQAPVAPSALDLQALTRFDALVSRTNERATSIMTALELQTITAAKVQRVCSARRGAADAGTIDELVHGSGA